MAQNNKVKVISILFLIILVVLLNGCKEPVELQSKWLDKKIVIDGDDIDWANYPYFYDEKTQSCLGFYNDSENIYIHFQTMDRDIQKEIERMGLTIWFNEQGGKEKELGLCFPAGGGPGRFAAPPGRDSKMPGLPPGTPEEISAPPPEEMEAKEMPASKTAPRGPIMDTMLKIMTGEEDEGYACNLEKAAKMGIEVKSRIDDRNRFIYELKMPYFEKENTAFFVTPSALNQIGMGIMTGGMKRGGPPQGMGGGGMDRGGRGGGDMPGGGDMGGRGPMGGGGMGGIGGGMGGGHRPGGLMGGSDNGSLEVWFRITLAPKPGI
ncbi:MAG: hypothetical protein JW927_21890 [Deltaproteobacteria bacterium]|nr:hypothetical protein [Deltaproteobacteria bacterium]